MIHLRARAAVGAMVLAVSGLCIDAAGQLTLAAAHAESETLRPEVSKPLQAAQELLQKKRYKEAVAKVGELNAVANKTPYEDFIIQRMLGAAALAAGDHDLAAKSFDAVLTAQRLPQAEQLKLMEAMAGAYYQGKEYRKAAAWAQRYLKDDPNGTTARGLLIQSLYLLGDYAAAAKELRSEFQADEKAGRNPPEERLRLLGNSYAQTNDDAAYFGVLERLLALYPKKEYWLDMLARVQRQPGFSDRLSLDLLRLQMATGNLTTTNQFMEMTQLALEAGLPAEARRIFDKGAEAGLLGSGADAERHKRLRELINKQVAEDVKALGEGDARAATAKNGIALVNIGFNYVANANFNKGIPLLEAGISKGGLKHTEDAKLHLGLAYLQAGNREKALQVLKSVQGGEGAGDIARLWTYVR